MKLGKGIRWYAIVTQYLLLIFTLLVGGVYAGSKLDLFFGTNFWDALLGLVGIFVGIFSFIYFILKQGKQS